MMCHPFPVAGTLRRIALSVFAILAVLAAFLVPPGRSAFAGEKGNVWGYRIVKTYPHDRMAYTQGLLWLDGFLYESTGQYGASSLRKVRL